MYTIDTRTGRPNCHLPPRLKCLTLCEAPISSHSEPVWERPAFVEPTECSHLEGLLIDFYDAVIVYSLLIWWKLPKLKRLSISSGCNSENQDQYLDIQSAPVSLCYVKLNLVLANFWDTLQQIILLDPYGLELRKAGVPWTSQLSITELVLGTKPAIGVLRRQGYSPMKSYCKKYSRLLWENDCQRKLQRLRVEQIDFYDNLILSIFYNTVWELRVLMLHP